MWPLVSCVNTRQVASIIVAIKINAGEEHVQIVDHALVT